MKANNTLIAEGIKRDWEKKMVIIKITKKKYVTHNAPDNK